MKKTQWAGLIFAVIAVYGIIKDFSGTGAMSTNFASAQRIFQDWLPLGAAVWFLFIDG